MAPSITSSARASSIGRIVRPSAFAVLRLPGLNVLKTAQRAAPATRAECPCASPRRCRVLKLGPRVLRPSSSLARRRELGQARDGQGRASQAIGGALDVLGRPLRNVLSFCPHLNRQAAALGSF